MEVAKGDHVLWINLCIKLMYIIHDIQCFDVRIIKLTILLSFSDALKG